MPHPPEWTKINGQTLVNTGITNADGSVMGATVLSAKGGTPVILNPTYTQFYTNSAVSISDIQVTNLQLRIFANGIDLSTNTPEFCVGQKVTFSGALNYDPGAVSTNYSWSFSSKFVNHSSQASPSASTNWDIDSSIFTTNEPYAYWVSGGNKNVYLHETLSLSNGQTATLSASGQFHIARPIVNMINPALNGTPMNVWITPWNMVDFGQITLGIESTTNNMSYVIQIISTNFAGDAKITQLCTVDAIGLISNVNVTNALDGSDPYGSGPNQLGSQTTVVKGPNPLFNKIFLDDSPGTGAIHSFHYYGTFNDFIMFKPAGDGIYVPLGKITWGTTFSATSPSLTINSNTVSGPIEPDSSYDPPVWTTTFP